MTDKTDDWDELLQSVVFSINTNKSATTGFSPFYLMYGRQARLPFEVETLDKNVTPLTEQIEDFKEQCQPYGENVVDHAADMIKIQQEIFPQVMSNIEKAQEKQKRQYLKRKGISDVKIADGDLVLRRNMLQKTKKGYKMQDHWLGPYIAVNINNKKGICYLKDPKNGMQLKRQISLKQLKIYQESSPLKPSDSPMAEAITPAPPSTTTIDPPATEIPVGSNAPTPPVTTGATIDPHTSQMNTGCSTVPSPLMTTMDSSATEIPSGSNTLTPPSTTGTTFDPPTSGIDTGCNKATSPSTTTVDPMATEIPSGSNSPTPSFTIVTSKSTAETTNEMQPEKHLEKHLEYNSIIEKLQMDDINQALDSLQPELNKILNGEEISWYYELHTTGKCSSQPELKKGDIPFNVHFGHFNDDQLEWITQKLVQNFPGKDMSVIFNILLPEAIIRISRDFLEVTQMKQMNTYNV